MAPAPGPLGQDAEMTSESASSSAALLRRGFVLEGITLAWNVVGVVILTIAAISARSVALGGFGLDSLIEIGASTVVIWELSGAGVLRQSFALRIIGIAFLILALYLAVQSTVVLIAGHHSRHSPVGMRGLPPPPPSCSPWRPASNGPVNNLATAVLAGLVLNAVLGWWWADPVAGYVILVYGAKEGVAALRHQVDP